MIWPHFLTCSLDLYQSGRSLEMGGHDFLLWYTGAAAVIKSHVNPGQELTSYWIIVFSSSRDIPTELHSIDNYRYDWHLSIYCSSFQAVQLNSLGPGKARSRANPTPDCRMFQESKPPQTQLSLIGWRPLKCRHSWMQLIFSWHIRWHPMTT